MLQVIKSASFYRKAKKMSRPKFNPKSLFLGAPWWGILLGSGCDFDLCGPTV